MAAAASLGTVALIARTTTRERPARAAFAVAAFGLEPRDPVPVGGRRAQRPPARARHRRGVRDGVRGPHAPGRRGAIAGDDGEGERRVAAAPADRVGGRTAARGQADAGRPDARRAGRRDRGGRRGPVRADAGSVVRHGGARRPRGLARAVAAGPAVPGRRVVRHARGGCPDRLRGGAHPVRDRAGAQDGPVRIDDGARRGLGLVADPADAPGSGPAALVRGVVAAAGVGAAAGAARRPGGHRCGAHAVAMGDRAHAVPRARTTPTC